jgi:chromate reductase
MIMEKPMNVCVLVGSLRKASFNGMLANALISLAPSSMKLEIVEIGQLPFYNQDLETNPPAAQWTAFRQRRAERARFLCSVDFGGPYDGLG